MRPKPESVSQDQNGYQGDGELPLHGSRAALFPGIPASLVLWVNGGTSFLLGIRSELDRAEPVNQNPGFDSADSLRSSAAEQLCFPLFHSSSISGDLFL